MKSSELLIKKIKEFEGLSLKAYKPVPTEKFYTIGYGHYGADVKKNQVITEKQAEELLRKDLVVLKHESPSHKAKHISVP